jgi:hypothetical protein
MKYLIILIILFVNLAHADVKIIASKSCKVDLLSKKDVKDLFMIKKKSISGESVIVIDSTEKDIYKVFVKEYMNKSLKNIKTYWVRMLFTGRKIPPKKLSLQDITSLDSKKSCYITYAKVDKTPKGWKEITVK